MKDTRKDTVTSQGSDVETDGYAYSNMVRKMIANKEYPYDVEFSDEYVVEDLSTRDIGRLYGFLLHEKRRGQKYAKQFLDKFKELFPIVQVDYHPDYSPTDLLERLFLQGMFETEEIDVEEQRKNIKKMMNKYAE